MSFLLGAALVLWWTTTSPLLLLLLCLLTAVLTIAGLRWLLFKPWAFLFAGFFYALLACQIQLSTQLTEPEVRIFSGKIQSLPKTNELKTSFLTTDTKTGQRFLLNWFHQNEPITPDFEPGQMYEFEVRVKPPHGTVNNVGFDREKWLFRNHINGIGTIKSAALINADSFSLIDQINHWRNQISRNIDTHFADDRVNGLIKALSIGDKSRFDQQDFQLFQQTGTAHLIAISGLHIGMVALIGWLIGSGIFSIFPQQRIPRPVIQVLLGLLLAGLYASLAGFAVSTQRALIMLVVYACFKLSRRASYAWDVWSISLILVLLLDPLNVLDAGFWLSFSAVAILILSFQGVQNQHHKIYGFFVIQWRLLLGMLPLSLLVFSHINLLTPLINMVMIPLMSFILVPLILLMVMIVSITGDLPAILTELIALAGQFFLTLLDWLATHFRVPFEYTIQYGWQMVLLVSGVFLLILPKAIPQRFWGLLLIFFAMNRPYEQLPPGHFKAQFFDVGQGLSVLIQTQKHNMLYDTGAAFDSGFNMADAVLLPYFRQHQISKLDVLLLSHQDNDHSGAAPILKQQTDIKQIYGTEEQHLPCVAGLKWQWDEVSFEVISPFNLSPYLKNNSSCVLHIETSKGFRLLLTGDIEDPVEFRLSKLPASQINAQVLLIPHHGSNTSSTEAFVKAVNPSIAINSSGQYNPFNHPTKQVLNVYQDLNIPIVDTQHSGKIEVLTFPEVTVRQSRQDHPKIWRKKSPE